MGDRPDPMAPRWSQLVNLGRLGPVGDCPGCDAAYNTTYRSLFVADAAFAVGGAARAGASAVSRRAPALTASTGSLYELIGQFGQLRIEATSCRLSIES